MIRIFIRRLLTRYQKTFLLLRITKLRIDFARHYASAFGFCNAWGTYRNLRSSKSGLKTIIPPGLQHPVFIRVGTSDVSVFEKIFVWREYFLSSRTHFEQILDCGANTGLSAVWFATQFPKATVIALEPDADNFTLLCRNVTPYPNIIPLKAAIWSSLCHVILENPEGEPDSFRFAVCSPDNPNSVQALDISTICLRYKLSRLDILKMDIEGGERAVFSANCDDWLRLTRILFVEFHDEDSRRVAHIAISKFPWSHRLQGENDCFVKLP
jgi:FkbM family methyltransferase